jgi:hypothetical protein
VRRAKLYHKPLGFTEGGIFAIRAGFADSGRGYKKRYYRVGELVDELISSQLG